LQAVLGRFAELRPLHLDKALEYMVNSFKIETTHPFNSTSRVERGRKRKEKEAKGKTIPRHRFCEEKFCKQNVPKVI